MKKVWNEPFDSGVEEGIKQGMEKGMEKCRNEIIERMIANLRPQKTDDELCSVLKSLVGISEDEARNYIAMAR